MDSWRLSQDSNSVSDWLDNNQQSLQCNCHDQEAFTVDSDVLQGIQEMREEEDVGGGVDINAVVSNDN